MSEPSGAFSKDALSTLDTFAERNRRVDTQAELIAGMPAMLERSVIYLIAAALVVTLAVLYFGKAQVTVETKGKILPEGNVVSLHAGQGGVVVGVFAHPGDHLAAGARVAEIDASEAALNLAQIKRKMGLDETQLQLFRVTLERLDHVLANPRSLLGERQAGVAVASSSYQLLNGLEDAQIKLETALQEERLLPERKQQMQQQYDLTKQRVAMLQRSLADQQRAFTAEEQALVRKKEQLENVRALGEKKLLSAVEVATEEERYRGSEQSLMNAQQRLDQLDVDIANANLQISELHTKLQAQENESQSNTRTARTHYEQALANLRQERVNIEAQARALESDIEHARQQATVGGGRLALATVTMPVDGTITEVRIHNGGEIVASGAPVATIMPNDVRLIVEATAPDKDVGFIKAGVPARIKVDAFPYQQFGAARARVSKVLPAVGNNASFVVQLELLDTKLTAGGNDFYLFPGLSVQADLITHEQRLLQVLLQGQTGNAKAESGKAEGK